MPHPQKPIRIFFSSTFLDMQKERDLLVTRVLPTLRERLYVLGISLIDIDLRWGVLEYEEDTREITNKWTYCKKAIDDNNDFFVAILGSRYGSRQQAHDLLESDFPKERKLSLKDCIGRSLTDIEIRYATDNFSNYQQPNPLFFYREEAEKSNYGQDQTSDELLESLKADIQQFCQQNEQALLQYHVDDYLHYTSEEADTFCETITDQLWSKIFYQSILPILQEKQIGNDLIETSEIVPEATWKRLIDQYVNDEVILTHPILHRQERFIAERNQHFFGRKDQLAALKAYVFEENEQV
ncbi:MAG: DUF4062 domain-containing protein, partial [Bacteroidota bacterium]